jgi:DNA mismatch endonuclease (patch repair protein)
MADIVTPEVRSRMMSGIRGKNTKPEMILRKGLHANGFRYRLHAGLPGRPDMVFPRLNAVVFVHGCFWHGHDCHLFKWPKSRGAFWRTKINGNIVRDRKSIDALKSAGWRVAIVWECALKGRIRLPPTRVIARCSSWLKSGKRYLELAGSDETRPSVRIL